MATDKEIRAQIDTESVKALLLMHGGASIATLAFLPHVIKEPGFLFLTKMLLLALAVYQVGLFLAALHNHYRRRCSEAHEKGDPPCTKFGRTFKEPCICYRSWGCMWFSLLAFLIAGFLIAYGGYRVLPFIEAASG